MSSIQVLPPHLIKQIAAGECIERPASVVKELIENSLDAQSSRIEIHIEDAGNRLIRVVDNGSGIAQDDLPLALASHATSKLHTTEDLMTIHTLGFRGEALASISSVAEVSLASSCGENGYIIEATGEQLSEIRPIGMAKGTCIEVRNLFFNIPARRKFLKSKNVEMGHITDAVIRLALSAHNVAFQLTHNQRHIFLLAVTDDPMNRIYDLIGSEDIKFFHTMEKHGSLLLRAYLGMPRYHKGSSKMEYFYLNRRYVRDRVALSAVDNAYRDYLPEKRYPAAVCFLEMDPSTVDVNVHPTKLEVRYRDSQSVYRIVYNTVITALRKQDITQEISLTPHSKPIDNSSAFLLCDPNLPYDEAKPTQVENIGDLDRLEPAQHIAMPIITDVNTDIFPMPDAMPSSTDASAIIPKPKKTAKTIGNKFQQTQVVDDLFTSRIGETQQATDTSSAVTSVIGEPQQATDTSSKAASGKHYINPRHCQVHNSYLILEVQDGIVIVDQHALHERILYERLHRELKSQRIISQPILFPENIILSCEEMATFNEWQKHLASIGIIAHQSADNQITITELPQILGKTSAVDIVGELIHRATQTHQIQLEEALDQMLSTMACKAAIKAGDTLNPDEILSLFSAKDETDNPFHCPHGRPTFLKITLKELEKYFQRR